MKEFWAWIGVIGLVIAIVVAMVIVIAVFETVWKAGQDTPEKQAQRAKYNDNELFERISECHELGLAPEVEFYTDGKQRLRYVDRCVPVPVRLGEKE